MESLILQHKLLPFLRTSSSWRRARTTTVNRVVCKADRKPRSLRVNAKGFTSARSRKLVEDEEEANVKRINGSKVDDGNDEIPPEVMNRMIVRILASVLGPLGAGFALMSVFGVISEQHVAEVPEWIPYLLVFLCFAASTIGIPYGALSTSLDADKKGSFFGLEEVKGNWREMWKEEDDLDRKKDAKFMDNDA